MRTYLKIAEIDGERYVKYRCYEGEAADFSRLPGLAF
jgi:hypothetical protein